MIYATRLNPQGEFIEPNVQGTVLLSRGAHLPPVFSLAPARIESRIALKVLSSAVAPSLPPPLPPVIPTIPQVEGVTDASSWTFDIVDESLIPREYLIPDRKAIKAIVTAMKARTNIPGVRARPDTVLRITAK